MPFGAVAGPHQKPHCKERQADEPGLAKFLFRRVLEQESGNSAGDGSRDEKPEEAAFGARGIAVGAKTESSRTQP